MDRLLFFIRNRQLRPLQAEYTLKNLFSFLIYSIINARKRRLHMSIAEKLFQLRKKAGYSQEELAEKIFVSRQAVSKWERGEALPDTENLVALSKLYGISLDELFGTPLKQPEKQKGNVEVWLAVPYPIVVTIAYLLWGVLTRGWAIGWTLYLTVPVYYTLFSAIRKRSFSKFAYPMLVTFFYCLFGMLYSIWHPLWVIFISIPVYYAIASELDRRG